MRSGENSPTAAHVSDLRPCHSGVVPYPILPVMAPTSEKGDVSQRDDAPAVEPTTPGHARSNVGRKRVTTPSLVRAMPSPSHSAKMAAIFREAHSSMQMPTTPCRPTPPSAKASRIPLAQHHLRTSETPVSIKSKIMGHSPKSPDAQDLKGMEPLARRESNKENQAPVQASPIRQSSTVLPEVERPSPSAHHAPTTISRLEGPTIPPRESSTLTPKSASRFHQQSTPSILLSQPPRRKKRPKLPDGTVEPRPTASPHTRSPFTIRPDDDEGIVPLSPDVTPYRKANRPKRIRCPSYFDDDILGPRSPSQGEGSGDSSDEYATNYKEPERRKGKVVLGESEEAKELTKQKAFVEDADGASFFGEKEEGE